MNDMESSPGRFSIRDLERLRHILRVGFKLGWAHYIDRLHLQEYLPHGHGEAVSQALSDAQRLRLGLEELGPTFVKFGQMLSIRQDLFPETVIQELQKLQDHVPTFPAEQARHLIEAELGRPVPQLYATFDDTPLAAASIAQVHTATLPDGTAVVIKIQRPDIEPVIQTDLEILFLLARLFYQHIPESRRFDPVGLVEEFADTLTREMDFRREGHNADQFSDIFSNESSVYVPRVFWELSSRRILTMEHSPGCHLGTDCPSDPADRQRLAEKLVQFYLKQVYEYGFFHGDPHPGNIFLLPDGRMCFHDFGIVGHLSPRDRDDLRELFLAVIARDPEWVADVYLTMGGAAPDVDRGTFVRDMSEALEHYYAAAAQSPSFAAIFNQFMRLGRHHQVHMLRQFLLAFRAFVIVESVAISLDVRFNMLSALQAYAPGLLVRQLLPDMTEAFPGAYRGLFTLRRALTGLPVALTHALQQMVKGELTITVANTDMGDISNHLDRASNRLSLSLIIAAVVIGSSLVMAFHTGPHYEGIPVLGLIGYSVASVLGLWWVVAILRSGRF